MNKVVIAILVVLLVGCSRSEGAIGNANKLYASGKYNLAIAKSLRALRNHEYGSEGEAELHYIMAQSYEKLGEDSKSIELYRHILAEFPGTKIALLAKTEVD